MTGPNVVQVNGPRMTWKRVTWSFATSLVRVGAARATKDPQVLDLADGWSWDGAWRAAEGDLTARGLDVPAREQMAPSSR